MKLRPGRKNPRNLYLQIGDAPSDDDPCVTPTSDCLPCSAARDDPAVYCPRHDPQGAMIPPTIRTLLNLNANRRIE